MKPKNDTNGEDASTNITRRIEELGDWRGELLAHVRRLIHEADPDIVEEWKWRGIPVWSHDGIVCTGESYKQIVKRSLHRRPDRKLLAQPETERMQLVALDRALITHPQTWSNG